MPARTPVAKSKPTAASKPVKPRTKARARKAARVVGTVMSAMNGGVQNEADLFSELEKLAEYIQSAKKEISALHPEEVKERFLPSASDELDAIIEATAEATNTIMDATEVIENVMAEEDGERADALMAATTAIYEACSFQDITGQRITKVVKTLQDIESKIDGLIRAFGQGAGNSKKSKAKAKKPVGKKISDEDLLNGPQSSGQAKSQAEIDALLASFD